MIKHGLYLEDVSTNNLEIMETQSLNTVLSYEKENEGAKKW